MNHDDVLKRAKNALQVTSGSGVPATVDHSKIEAVLARARAAAEERPRPVVVAAPPKPAAAPGVARVHLQMFCSAAGKSFIGIAERRGSELRLVGHEAQPENGGTTHTEMLSGAYTFASDSAWACPFCRIRSDSICSVWTCQCSGFGGVLHCGGTTARGASYCICGLLEKRTMTSVPALELCGASVVSTSLNTHSNGASSHSAAPPRGGVPSLLRKS